MYSHQSCFSRVYSFVFDFFFFKQKTAYEMRISDWSSDVCSSDLTLFVEMCDNLKKKGKGTNRHLSDELLKASLKKIYESLKGTVADPLISPDAAKMAQSIRAVLNAHAESIRFMPDNGEPFSIKDWIERDDGNASLQFITARY